MAVVDPELKLAFVGGTEGDGVRFNRKSEAAAGDGVVFGGDIAGYVPGIRIRVDARGNGEVARTESQSGGIRNFEKGGAPVEAGAIRGENRSVVFENGGIAVERVVGD